MKITWWAIGAHAFLALAIGGLLFGLASLTSVQTEIMFVVWIIGTLIFGGREVLTAARRHKADWQFGLYVVATGEPGFSPWNLRLQALAPSVVFFIFFLMSI